MQAIQPSNITGLIFAGGRATRLGGANKALTHLLGRTLIERMVDRLEAQCSTIVVSANRDLEYFEKLGFPVVKDLDGSYPGPLGALAALSQSGFVHSEWVLTVPCDAPFFPCDLMLRFARAQCEKVNAQAFVARVNGRKQAAFACVRTPLLAHAQVCIDSGEHRLRAWLDEIDAAEVEFDDENAFANLNSPQDLRDARIRLKKSSP